MKFHPLAELFPLMQARELDELAADIRANGLHEPVTIFENQILDGRNRWRACEQLGIEAETRDYSGRDPLGFVISLNLHRRHLTDGQKAVLALDILPHLEEQARYRQLSTLKQGESVPERIPEREPVGDSRDQAAVAVGVNPRYVSDAKRIAREAPHLVDRMRSGELSVPAAMRQLRDDERKANLQRPVAIELHPGIHRGDFRDLAGEIPDNSVELVFTDPPYSRENVPIFVDAAREAMRILKPGGSYIAYCGQVVLREMLAACEEGGLRYWWLLTSVNQSGRTCMHEYAINSKCKPLVWFVKGTRGDRRNFLDDCVSGGREKELHPWQQAEAEAAYYIEKLTSPRGLVVDFFLGSGTTAAAAQKLGRPWIGFEVDAAAAETASERLGAEAPA